jgi:hypothetical protein
MGAGLRFPDFDALVELHRHDPQSFEEMRRSMLRAAVDEAPVAHRAALEQLLVRIETARAAAATPDQAAQAAFRMMCDSVDDLRCVWERARVLAAEWQTALLIERARGR